MYIFCGTLYLRMTPGCTGLHPIIWFSLSCQKSKGVHPVELIVESGRRRQLSNQLEIDNISDLASFDDYVDDDNHILALSTDVGDAM